MPAELTPKQKMFADEYILTGNATQSYLKVYQCSVKNAESSSSDLLRNPKVKAYITSVNEKLDDGKIATMKEVKEFWTELIRSREIEPRDRLKASEYIAKTNAAFIDKVDVSGEVTLIQVKPPSFDEDDDE